MKIIANMDNNTITLTDNRFEYRFAVSGWNITEDRSTITIWYIEDNCNISYAVKINLAGMNVFTDEETCISLPFAHEYHIEFNNATMFTKLKEWLKRFSQKGQYAKYAIDRYGTI